MKIFFSILRVLIRTSLAFLDTTLAPNTDLSPALPLHFLQAVTARTDEKTEEVDFRELLDGYVNLFRRTLGALLLVVFDGRAEAWVILHSAIYETNPLILQFFAVTDFASVGTTTMGVISGRRRGRSSERDQIVRMARYKEGEYKPLALRRNVVIKSEFSVYLLQAKMDSIVVELRLGDTGRIDGSRQTWKLSFGLAPAATPFSSTIRIS